MTDKEIRINGPKGALARIAGDPEGITTPGVLFFVREWRAAMEDGENYSAAVAWAA